MSEAVASSLHFEAGNAVVVQDGGSGWELGETESEVGEGEVGGGVGQVQGLCRIEWKVFV